jgi:hypothetical protein
VKYFTIFFLIFCMTLPACNTPTKAQKQYIISSNKALEVLVPKTIKLLDNVPPLASEVARLENYLNTANDEDKELYQRLMIFLKAHPAFDKVELDAKKDSYLQLLKTSRKARDSLEDTK